MDSQEVRTLIQGCLLGDSDGSRVDDGEGMGVFRTVCGCDGRQERSAAVGPSAGARWSVLDRAHGRAMARSA